jgi:apolipoprotein N-acyltransferase
MNRDSQGVLTAPPTKPAVDVPLRPSELAGNLKPKSRVLLPALATALLLWLCYYPAACGWLAWVALVPLLCLVRTSASARRVYLGAWVAGLLFFGVTLQWMRVADLRMYATWIALAIYCALYFPVALYLLRRLDRGTRWPLVVTLPLVWTGLEFARSHLLGGFAWYFLGHSQHQFLAMIQTADLAGVYAISFVVAAVNGLLFELLCTRAWSRTLFALPAHACRLRFRVAIPLAIAVGILVAATLLYGLWRLGQNDFAQGPRVALVQGNLEQRIRNEASSPEGGEKAARQVVRHYSALCDLAAKLNPPPDLIVWPETTYPYYWMEVAPDVPPERVPEDWQIPGVPNERIPEVVARENLDLAQKVAWRWKTNVLLGLNAADLGADGHTHRANTALLIRKAGELGGRYDKIHCIPFGEYVPFRETLPWMNVFAPYDFDYSITPGTSRTRFNLGLYHFGVVICYEDTDPVLARHYVDLSADKEAVDFLVNMSNDGWFDGTSEHEEHLAICRFRAIECRRSVVRAVNMGISAVIDPNGRIVALPDPDWSRSKKVEAIVTAAIPIDHRASLYAAWGDWLPWLCWLAIAACFFWSGGWARRLRPVGQGN